LLRKKEWEEKLNSAQQQAEIYQQKYITIRNGKETSMMEDARNNISRFPPPRVNEGMGDQDGLGSMGISANAFRSAKSSRPEFQKGVESVASMGSSLAQHAKTLVGSFACAGNNERTGQVLVSERATEEWRGRRSAAAARFATNTSNSMPPGLEMSNSTSTRSYRENAAATTTTTTTKAVPPRHIDV
jgi:hypothetical protein